MENNKISEEDKKYMDKILPDIISQEWQPESCMQEFYSEFFVSPHYNFYHKGHEYFITFDKDEEYKDVWVIYDRDLEDENYKYNTFWEDEPKAMYKNLPELAFCFRLKNDGRTLCEYICDFNNMERLLVPEPVDKNKVGKIWKR